MDLIKTGGEIQRFQPHQHSQKLIQCLIKLESPELKSEAKMELLSMAGELMPAGKPTFLEVIRFPMIKKLTEEHGKKTMMKVLFLMIKDFCSSMNVVRNMNEDQMIESAAMLLDECDNFRMEDYVMMFQMAKRGDLVKVMDRIDINVITQMLDAYWEKRRDTALSYQDEEERKFSGYGSTTKVIDDLHPQDAKLSQAANNLAGAIGDLKNRYKEWKEDNKIENVNPQTSNTEQA